jgi:hypothetical protein
MTGATHYPKASKHYYSSYPGTPMGGISKLLLHSTEGGGWPAYDNGAIRPTLTYHPGLREWREHGRLDYSARALVDPSSTLVRENRDQVAQVEIIGTCDPVAHKAHPSWPYMPELGDGPLDDLAEFLAFLHTEWHVPLVAAPVWLPYPVSYGAKTKARMSGAQYDAFMGLCGHMHPSGNVHGDPGGIAAGGIVSRAVVLTTIRPATNPVLTTNIGGTDTMYRLLTEKGHYFYGGSAAPTPIPNGALSGLFNGKVVDIHTTEAFKNTLSQYHLAGDRALVNAVVAAITPTLKAEGINPAELAEALSRLEIPPAPGNASA